MISIGLAVLGLVIGSFLGALTWRLPRGMSIAKGRSICPSCKKQIEWFDNIPLLSYIFLLGKCRNCRKKISIRYPLIEALTAITFLVIGFHPVYLAIASILIVIFVIDFEHQFIPDEFVFLGLLLLIFCSQDLFSSLLAGFLSAIILLFLHLITRGYGMGLGDVKLALLLGSLVGLKYFLIWLFFAFVSGALVGVILIIFKKAKFNEKIAFGPFLIMAVPLTIFFGNMFLNLIGL